MPSFYAWAASLFAFFCSGLLCVAIGLRGLTLLYAVLIAYVPFLILGLLMVWVVLRPKIIIDSDEGLTLIRR